MLPRPERHTGVKAQNTLPFGRLILYPRRHYGDGFGDDGFVILLPLVGPVLFVYEAGGYLPVTDAVRRHFREPFPEGRQECRIVFGDDRRNLDFRAFAERFFVGVIPYDVAVEKVDEILPVHDVDAFRADVEHCAGNEFGIFVIGDDRNEFVFHFDKK